MADINPYIEKIQNAIYGEEVRGSIISSLEKVNDDNEKYQDIKAETVEAAGVVKEKADQFSKDFAQAKTTIEQLKTSTSTANTAKSNLDAVTKTANTTATDLQNKTTAATTAANRADTINSVLLESTQEAIEASTQLEGNLINVLTTEQVENITIKEEVTGEIITLQDSADWRVKGMTLYGRSEQFKTTGTQLLDVNNVTLTSGVTIDGTKVTVAGKGLCYDIFAGIAGVEHIVYNTEKNPYLVAGTYTFSTNVNADYHLFAITENHEFNYKSRGRTIPLTFTITEPCYISIGPSGSTVTSGVTFTISDMILTVDGNDLSWEPYTGGKPSPSPEYPQEIVSVGDSGALGISVTGTQLLNIKDGTQTVNGITAVSKDGEITLNGTVTEGYSFIHYPLQLPPGTYCIAVNNKAAVVSTNTLIRLDNNKETFPDFFISLKKTYSVLVFTVTNENITDLTIRTNTLEKYTDFKIKPMIALSETPVHWEPYIGQQLLTVPLPEPLRGIPVEAIVGGNYTDVDGKLWICDTVEYKNGAAKIVRRIKQHILNGSEVYRALEQSDDEIIIITNKPEIKNKNAYFTRCNRFPFDTNAWHIVEQGNVNTYRYDANHNIYFRLAKTDFPDVNVFKEWLSTNNVKIIFPLDIPTEEPLTPEQFAALKTYYQYTTIYNDADADMSVTYVADPKIYMDNKFKEIQNAIVSLGGNV